MFQRNAILFAAASLGCLTYGAGAGAATTAPATNAGTKAPPPTKPKGLTLEQYLKDTNEQFNAIDANGDGIIDLAEFELNQAKIEHQRQVTYYSNLFNSLDTDKNGVLTRDEFMRMVPALKVTSQRGQFDTYDYNHDGRISRSEWVVRMSNNFDQLDLNKDGVIDEDELAHKRELDRVAPQAR